VDTKGESKRGGFTAGKKPLDMLTGSLRGAKPLSHHLPLPLIKGKGDKGRRLFEGMGLLNNIIVG